MIKYFLENVLKMYRRYETRKAVQKIMMRPDSALHYVPEVESIAEELVDKVEADKDGAGNLEVNKLFKQFATDAIALMFIGRKVGAMEGSEDGDKMIEYLEKILQMWGEFIYLPVWLGKYHPNMNKMGRYKITQPLNIHS